MKRQSSSMLGGRCRKLQSGPADGDEDFVMSLAIFLKCPTVIGVFCDVCFPQILSIDLSVRCRTGLRDGFLNEMFMFSTIIRGPMDRYVLIDLCFPLTVTVVVGV